MFHVALQEQVSDVTDPPEILQIKELFDAQVQVTCEVYGANPCWWRQLRRDIRVHKHHRYPEGTTKCEDCGKARKLS